MTRGEGCIKKGKGTKNHRSAMSNKAWCDPNNNIINNFILRLHDFCPNPKNKCQNQLTFTPKHFQLGRRSTEIKLKSIFRRSQAAWNKFLKPANNETAPFIGMAVSAKTKNPKVGQATTNSSRNISGGKFLSLTDMYGNGLRLRVM